MATTRTDVPVAPAPAEARAAPAERYHTAVPPLHHNEHKSHVPQLHGHETVRFMRYEIPARGASYLGFSLLILAFALAGILTHLFIAKVGDRTDSVNLWRTCSSQPVPGSSATNATCEDVDDNLSECRMMRFNALRAFGIMTVIVVFFVCIPLAIFDLFHELPPRTGKNLMVAIAAIVFAFTLVYWGIGVGLWANGCDGGNAFHDVSGSKYGASIPLFIVAWTLSMAMMMSALVLPGVEHYYPHKHHSKAIIPGRRGEVVEPNPDATVVQMQPTNKTQPNPAFDPQVPVRVNSRNEPVA